MAEGCSIEVGKLCCIVNTSDEHSITFVTKGGAKMVVPPKHAADVVWDGHHFESAEPVTPDELAERYGQ